MILYGKTLSFEPQINEIYFLQATKPLGENVRKILKAEEVEGTPSCIIMPRKGTISPWSSRATEILHSCGCTHVNRVEKGLAFWTDDEEIINSHLDKMTQEVLPQLSYTFDSSEDKSDTIAVEDILDQSDIDYLTKENREPTLTEAMMFAQVNSEHCRHKIFNASWTIDGEERDESLFSMIKETHRRSPINVLSAYKDNAAVIRGHKVNYLHSNSYDRYVSKSKQSNISIKVETHNHPTLVHPYPGAGTGAGGEIRDEAATGRGGIPRAGLTGYSVSDLNDYDSKYANSLQIMLEAPIGAATYNNEFGRPNLCGYFRTFQHGDRGYHKPIMIAGGHGRVFDTKKRELSEGDLLVVLGGPSMLIGLGGGSSSSVNSGEQDETLDFASVQRANPEMQRRCQEVITKCAAMNGDNPILSIHDVGAGGLSNALPELVNDSGKGAVINLKDIPTDDPTMTPMEIWCNESQERYVIGIEQNSLDMFESVCKRENAPFAVVGKVTNDRRLVLDGVDISLTTLLEDFPAMKRVDTSETIEREEFDISKVNLDEAALEVLRLPTVGSKSFLITIGDRTVTGLVARDQMVGPWQVPVSDVAITKTAYGSQNFGEVMAMGERTPIALLNAPASGRMAVGEVITNMASTRISWLNCIKLSANWMVASDKPGEGAKLYETVKAVSEMCRRLGIAIPVGKDSMSMRTEDVSAPLSLVVSGFAPTDNVNHTLTPELQEGDTELWLVDLGEGKNRLGASSLAYVYGEIGSTPPDVVYQNKLMFFFAFMQKIINEGLGLAYHDRSDGGLWTTLCEMSFASHLGLEIDITKLGKNPIASLFSEELGAVIQIKSKDREKFETILLTYELDEMTHYIGKPTKETNIKVTHSSKTLLNKQLVDLMEAWTDNSYRMQKLRDNEECAEEERATNLDFENPGIHDHLTFNVPKGVHRGWNSKKVAILREQGTNGHVEMASAFSCVGFDTIDVHMNDLRTGSKKLSDFVGMVACGGFSYGDVLGAGHGWANSILYNDELKGMFEEFFYRSDTFTLGVCNGCQMLSLLRDLIPGADWWPSFKRNRSDQFEARLSLVEVLSSPSIFFRGMEGSSIPIPVSHGEGKAVFRKLEDYSKSRNLSPIRYIDNWGRVANTYPANPNGSSRGLTAFTTPDGRATIMMPHPERAIYTTQLSWRSKKWGNNHAPWIRMFQNARDWRLND